MTAKQVSVFIENRQGRLTDVLHVLKENDVNILSISLADTTEYGLLRLILNKPEKAREVLIEAGFSSMITEVLIIKVPHVTGALQGILELVAKKNISIEYMYGLSIDGKSASVVVKTSDLDFALNALNDKGIVTLSTDDVKGF